MTAVDILVLALGPFIGSFVGVLVTRLPEGRDVIFKRSACASCGAVLRARDLIPIVSYVWRSGGCACCGASIPPKLLYLEIIGAGLGLLAVLAGGLPMHVLLSALMLWLLLALGACDLEMFRLPDALNLALFITVLLRTDDIGIALIGAGCGVAAFALLRWGYLWVRGREGLGLGDIKLMAGLGALTGPYLLPHLVLGGALLALAGAGVVALRGAQVHRHSVLPFGTALVGSAAGLWLAGFV